ncbi:hypothetical protein EZV61_16640 [Corallincola luteus]|uniref:Nitrate/nitrite sensing protein domain-containing protein n=1 Tax=Corallincola luteus TaxID=1775177 RepID=A0ABY2AKI9_9GAMM|nr:nitrate- and nitrite sensing domain-containing protein [Corallincola luteus]TCI01892.1 hypothetical protein EZV61_16640 [Corallincola luteus]
MLNTHIDISIVVTLVTALLFLVLVISWVHLRNKQVMTERVSTGLAWLKSFRQLLTLIQQHRGLTNGYLCGDSGLNKRILPLQGKTTRLIRQLQLSDSWLADNPEWQGIERHWQRLSTGFNNQTSANNLEQHNKLITNLLYLVDDCGEAHRLYELKDQQGRSIRYLWQSLLVTAEHIGQARAIGTGVAASGQCDSVDRIRLAYLQKAIADFVAVERAMNKTALSNLLQVLAQEVITDRPTVSANEYFDIATQALEEVFVSFDQAIEALQETPSGFTQQAQAPEGAGYATNPQHV